MDNENPLAKKVRALLLEPSENQGDVFPEAHFVGNNALFPMSDEECDAFAETWGNTKLAGIMYTLEDMVERLVADFIERSGQFEPDVTFLDIKHFSRLDRELYRETDGQEDITHREYYELRFRRQCSRLRLSNPGGETYDLLNTESLKTDDPSVLAGGIYFHFGKLDRRAFNDKPTKVPGISPCSIINDFLEGAPIHKTKLMLLYNLLEQQLAHCQACYSTMQEEVKKPEFIPDLLNNYRENELALALATKSDMQCPHYLDKEVFLQLSEKCSKMISDVFAMDDDDEKAAGALGRAMMARRLLIREALSGITVPASPEEGEAIINKAFSSLPNAKIPLEAMQTVSAIAERYGYKIGPDAQRGPQ